MIYMNHDVMYYARFSHILVRLLASTAARWLKHQISPAFTVLVLELTSCKSLETGKDIRTRRSAKIAAERVSKVIVGRIVSILTPQSGHLLVLVVVLLYHMDG